MVMKSNKSTPESSTFSTPDMDHDEFVDLEDLAEGLDSMTED